MIGNILLKIKHNKAGWKKQMYFYFKSRYLLNKIKKGKANFKKDYIVSFTTYKPRLKASDYALRSIINGKILPEAIYLYLTEEDYSIIILRSFVKALKDTGYLHLEVVSDVKSYKKLIYALESLNDKNIVICDDDIFYPRYWFQELVYSREKWNNNNIISCHRAHQVKRINGEIMSYEKWEKDVFEPTDSSSSLFPTGTGGVLYPPNSISPLAMESELFLRLAPSADDVWFWFCSLYNNSKFVLTDRKIYNNSDFVDFPNSQESSLYIQNVNNNANDIQIQNVFNYFKSIDYTY